MTNSTLRFDFPPVGKKEVQARFDGGDLTSDGGLLLLKKADGMLGLTGCLSASIHDSRQRGKVRHAICSLVRQRVFGIACGYGDANDHDTLCSDAALKIACGRAPQSGADLASQPTLSRLENIVTRRDLRRMAICLGRVVVGRLPKGCKRIVLDVDATEDPCHGQQEFSLFNRFYDSSCFLPLLLFATGDDGQRRLMGALLRHGRSHGTHGLRVLLKWAVRLIGEKQPDAQIIIRADSGFGCAKTVHCCEELGIDFILGLQKNARVTTLAMPTLMDACIKYTQLGYLKQRPVCREFGEFGYKAQSWKKKWRVVAKAEITQGELNPRYVVTSLKEWDAESIYDLYCERGDAENGIKEFKNDLLADRTSCHRFAANQFRLLLHLGAAVLMQTIRDAASQTKYAKAQIGTLRLRLLKVGARIVESVRRVQVHLSSSYPDQESWRLIDMALVT